MTKEDSRNIIAHIFIQWATSKGILDEWLTYCIDHNKGIETNGVNSSFASREPINYGIIWDNTSEGWQYWSTLNSEWMKAVEGVLEELENE